MATQPNKPLNLTKTVQGPAPQAVKAASVAAKAAEATPDDKYKLRPFGRGTRLNGVDPTTADGKKAVEDALDDYVMLEPLSGGKFNYRATCRECAWQTHTLGRDHAIDAVKHHAQRHLFQP